MTDNEKKILRELIEAARPFTSGDTVDETSGTIPKMDRLEQAIDDAEKLTD